MIKSVIFYAAVLGFAMGIGTGVYFLQDQDEVSDEVTLIDGEVNDSHQDVTLEPESVVIPEYSPWWSAVHECNTNMLSNLGNYIDRVSVGIKYHG